VVTALAGVLFGLLATGATGLSPAAAGAPDLVVVTLPANASPAILEALNRLRGEATSVGFEVRLVDAATLPAATATDGSAFAGLRAAAVVGFARAGDTGAPHSLDVTFVDRGSGKISVAHLTADDVGDAPERADVIIAVRAVDFIRARMFDTLADRRVEPTSTPPAPAPPPARRFHLAGGMALLGTPTGFSPAVAAHLALGYQVASWLRLGASAFGLGSEPQLSTTGGRVRLDQRFLGAGATALLPAWHHVQPMFDVAGGEYWIVVRGDATPPLNGQAQTLSSPGLLAEVGLAIGLLPALALELRGGSLWLQSEVHVQGTPDVALGRLGRPLWLGGATLAASF
jgi:hypothetical protein